jgi:phosphoserine phosphatase
MTTNLILQSPAPDISVITRIAAFTGNGNLARVSSHGWGCQAFDSSPAVRAIVHKESYAAGIDACFVPARRTLNDFCLLAMDMDSTLITIECIDEIADLQGLKPQVSAITEAAMRGELDFSESLKRRVALLAGLESDALQQVIDQRLQLSPGALPLLAAAKAAGIETLLVSGGFTFFTDYMQGLLGLTTTRSNVLEIVDGKLTGRVIGEIVDATVKQRVMLETCKKLGIGPDQAIAVGDGANDLKMMSVAGLSVAFRAKPVVRGQADVALNFMGLDGILALFAAVD